MSDEDQAGRARVQTRITVDPEVCHGQACIKGTRIPVVQMLGMLANGDTIEDLLEEFPHVTRADIEACLDYAVSLQVTTRHYSYRMDHDTGYAPHVARGFCTLCGCKKTTIERRATPGSWVVGVGGNGTTRPDRLIYAMRVDSTPTFAEFKKQHQDRAAYLREDTPREARVLVSRHFYYFGDNAPELPPKLEHIIHSTQGCKRLDEEDAELLRDFLDAGWTPGKHGKPSNPRSGSASCRKHLPPTVAFARRSGSVNIVQSL